MALLFMDGFDYYSSDQYEDLATKWQRTGLFYTSSMNAVTGAIGSGSAISLQGLGDIARNFTSVGEIIIGFNHKFTNNLSVSHIRFYDLATIQLSLGFDASDHFVVRRGTTTVLGTSSSTFAVDTWFHVELRIKIDNSVGTIELRVDGNVEIGPLTNQDTQVSANATIDMVNIIGDNSNVPVIDDFYILDTTGSRLNDFLGPVYIETIYPDGAGAATDFTPSAGSNWQNVDEVVPDDDTTYNEDTVVSSKDRFTVGNLVGDIGDIHAVAVNARAKKTEAGARTVRMVAYDGTTEGESADQYFTFGDYFWQQALFEDHPTGAAVWTESEVNSGEFGYKIQA